MNFIKFTFSFLFVRNWHTGQLELSQARLIVFIGMLFLFVLGLLLVTLMQSPVTYEAVNTL